MGSGGRDTRQWMLWAFKIRGCVDCGWVPQSKADLALIHCDHRDPSTKARFGKRSVLNAGGVEGGLLGANRNNELLLELLKCDPVCQPCHVERGRVRARAHGLPASSGDLLDLWRAVAGEPSPLAQVDGQLGLWILESTP